MQVNYMQAMFVGPAIITSYVVLSHYLLQSTRTYACKWQASMLEGRSCICVHVRKCCSCASAYMLQLSICISQASSVLKDDPCSLLRPPLSPLSAMSPRLNACRQL